MEKKPVNTRERNKDKSKQQFLDAVGKILKTKGYQALKVNDIAATAGLDKKLIYKYFGGTDQLLDEYIRTQDFWSNVKMEASDDEITDGGQAFSIHHLLEQFDYVYKNEELQKVLLWRLSESRKSLKKLTEDQEANGEQLFKSVGDIYFGDHARDFRAVMAILVSGAYYLNLYSAVNGSIFCGLDLKQTEDRDTIKQALSFLVEQAYASLKETE